jgi:hypothetical protein
VQYACNYVRLLAQRGEYKDAGSVVSVDLSSADPSQDHIDVSLFRTLRPIVDHHTATGPVTVVADSDAAAGINSWVPRSDLVVHVAIPLSRHVPGATTSRKVFLHVSDHPWWWGGGGGWCVLALLTVNQWAGWPAAAQLIGSVCMRQHRGVHSFGDPLGPFLG